MRVRCSISPHSVFSGVFGLVLAGFFILFFIPSFQFFLFPKITKAESVNVNLEVAICNENMVCEEVIGENYQYCPTDCEAPPPPPPPPSSSTGSSQSVSGSGYVTGRDIYSTSWFDNIPLEDDNLVPGLTTGTQPKPGTPVSKPSIKTPIKSPTLPLSGINGPIKVAPFKDRAVLNFKTFFPSLLNISWGITGTYELGVIADSWYHQNFSKEISNLEPGTRYYYHIQLLDSLRRVVNYEGSFITVFSDSKARLPTIINFVKKAGQSPDQLAFVWDIRPGYNTINKDIDDIFLYNKATVTSDAYDPQRQVHVRLVRSEISFPLDPMEGKVIYEGSGEQAVDVGLANGRTYFYSIFLMDKEGNFSAPAIISHTNRSKIDDTEKTPGSSGKIPYDPLVDDNSSVILDTGTDSDPRTTMCNQSESGSTVTSLKTTRTNSDYEVQNQLNQKYKVRFIQDGTDLSFDSGKLNVDGQKKLIIRVKSDNSSELDQVRACFFPYTTGNWNRYLLTRNSEGDYELIFPALSSVIGGKIYYQFALEMLEYKGEIETLWRGEIIFNVPKKQTDFPIKQTAVGMSGIGLLLALIRWTRILFLGR